MLQLLVPRLRNKLVASVSCAARNYATDSESPSKWTAPQLAEKDRQGFFVDTRRGQREVMDVDWTPKVPLKGPIRFEIADPEDLDMFSQFNAEVFSSNCQFSISAGTTFEKEMPLIYEFTRPTLPQRLSFLVFDDDKLIGLSANCIHSPAEMKDMFPYGTGHVQPQLEMLPDYADTIARYDLGNHEANKMAAFLVEATARAGPFFPRDMGALGLVDREAIHGQYLSTGLGAKMMETSVQMLQQAGADCLYGHCVARGTEFICTQRYGFRKALEVPYARFLEHGKPVFGPRNDGMTGDTVILKQLRTR